FENLDNLTATLYTNRTQYNLLTKDVVESDETKELQMVKTTAGDKAIYTAIFAPGTVSDEIIFTDGNDFYSATLSLTSAEAAKLYSFTATVGDQGYSVVELENDGVTDWDTQADSALGVGLEIVDGVYQIYTAAGLKIFADAVNSGDTSIDGKLMNNIDLEGSESNQWTPIGGDSNNYKGTFDGGGYCVSGLYINQPDSDYQALFGYISGATIKNVGVSGSVTGYDYVSGVVGRAFSSTVTNCYNTAAVEGDDYYVGGVVGYAASSTVTNCYNTAAVKGSSHYVGGVVGRALSSTVTNCYNAATVEGNSFYVGGVVGCAVSSTVTNCYNKGSVKGADYVGGIVGLNEGSATLSNSYNTAVVADAGSTSNPYVGGVVGCNESTVTNCYFDSDNYSGDGVGYANNSATTTNVIGYSTTIMQGDYLVALLNRVAYSYNEGSPSVSAYGWVAEDGDYPTLDSETAPTYADICNTLGSGTESDPYLIIHELQLRDLSDKVNGGEAYSGKYFKMTCDIDLGGIDDEGNGVAENEFTAIGTYANKFQATFDGGGYEVSGLYINQPEGSYQGLFGYIGTSNVSPIIKNIGVSGSVTGYFCVGGVLGYAYNGSAVSSCYNKATVVSKTTNAGGIVGYAIYANVSDCYNTAVVEGTGNVGGIVGTNSSSCTVSNSYNTATIKLTASDGYVGGVVGYNRNTRVHSNILNCYSTGGIEMAEGVTTDYAGGIAGYNEDPYYDDPCVVENCIYDSSVFDGEAIGVNEGTSTNNSGSANLKSTMTSGSFSTTLGDEWVEDSSNINDEYPILSWQVTSSND
ncbi:MAG: GLUG motif-containing protein, partial [Rikenellaceae bacterium]